MTSTNTARKITDLFYYAQPVESNDQVVSLTEYLNRHGVTAYAEGNDQVIVPLDKPSKTIEVYTLVQTWRKFWESSDKGVFSLPIYAKD